jgi:hypothetical protein
MAADEDDDLYDEEFDFVDEDDELDDDSDLEDESPMVDEEPADERAVADRGGDMRGDGARGEDMRGDESEDEPVDEYGRPEPAANYVVHVYEHQKYKRTIDRPFTAEDAEAFATEMNRTGKNYGRVAVSGKNDTKPKKALE